VLAIFREGEVGFDPAHPDRVYDGWRDAHVNGHGPDSNTEGRSRNTEKLIEHFGAVVKPVDVTGERKGRRRLSGRMTGIHMRIRRAYSGGMATTDPITPSLRRFSIRLPRWLWIGLAAVVPVVVGVGLRVGVPIYRQHLAIREIERLGGTCETRPRDPQWLRNLRASKLRVLRDEVVGVGFDSPQVTDATLVHLRAMTSLELIQLDNAPVTDAGLVHLAGMRNLRTLRLKNTRVTENGIAELKRALPGLMVEW
jgi:hypothetical protein